MSPSTASPRSRYVSRYGYIVLLWLGLLVSGAKTPLCFAMWAAVAALISLALVLDRRLPVVLYSCHWEALVAVALVVSLMMSEDRTTSLYVGSQQLFFVWLWLVLKAVPEALPNTQDLYRHLGGMGVVVLGVWVWQQIHTHGQIYYGLLPANPIFNAIWMASVGLGLIVYALPRRGSLPGRGGLAIIGGLLVLTAVINPVRTVAMTVAMAGVLGLRPWITARRLIGVLIGMVLLWSFFSDSLLMRLHLSQTNDRWRIWTAAVQSIKDHPWRGLGPGNFELGYQRHAFPVPEDTILYARSTEFTHDEFLQLAAESGIPAALLVTGGLLRLFIFSLKKPRSPDIVPDRIALFVLSLAALTNIVWHMPLLIYMSLLWAARIYVASTPTPAVTPFVQRRVVLAVLGACTLPLIFWCGLRDSWAAKGQWSTILRWNPHDAWAWKEWAQSQPTVTVSVLNAAQRSVDLAPGDFRLHETFGHLLESTRASPMLNAASHQYQEAGRLAPSRALDWLSAGRMEFALGRTEDALIFFRRARETEPNDWEADLWIARCLTRLGRPDLAVWTLTSLVKRRDEHYRWRHLFLQQDVGSNENTPSTYAQAILAYDDRVVEKELNQDRLAAAR